MANFMFSKKLSVFYLLLILLSACGVAPDSPSETGSIDFKLEWEPPIFNSELQTQNFKLSLAPGSDVCADYGIATVSGKVLNSSNTTVASSDWSCSAHIGTITGVPTGSNYTIRFEGIISGGTAGWRSDKTGVTINTGQAADVGVMTMTYIGNDNTPPTVSSTNPSDNETNIPVTVSLTATFSEKMASSSINTSSFTLKKDTTSVTGSVTYDSSTKKATCTPSSNLSYSTIYTVTITTDVEDMAGNKMTGSHIWRFTTESAPTSAPSAPTGVTATAGDGQATISWAASSGATSYNIYWSTTTGVTKTTGTKITGATSPYTHTGRTNGTTYYYVVTAVNSYGESSESSQVSAMPVAPGGTLPSAPTNVTATAGNGQVTITWNTVSGATSYNIYWSTTSGVAKTNGTKISNATSPYPHTGRTNGTTYYYVVTAVSSYGESGESSEVSAAPGTVPSAPTGVTATAGDGQVTISWTAVSDATSYNIYWATTTGVTKTTGTKIENATSPYMHTNLTNGTTYYYVVTAVNSYGESSASSQVSAMPVARGATLPFSDDMESGTNKWFVSSHWMQITTDKHSGSTSWTDSPGGDYTDYTNASLTSVAFDTTGSTLLRLSFWHKFAFDDDYGKVEVSTNNGSTWTEVASYGNFQTQNSWTQTSIDLSSYKGYSSVKIRFRLQTDYYGVADGWYIDDVVIQEAPVTATLPFSDDMESGTNKWFVSSHWMQITTDKHSGSTSWTDSPGGDYTDYTNASLTSVAFDTTGSTSLRLSFWHKFAFDDDYGKVEVSTNNGSTWTEVASYGNFQTQNSWTQTSIDLSSYKGYSSVKIRFRLQTDYYGVADGWYIDDVEIKQ